MRAHVLGRAQIRAAGVCISMGEVYLHVHVCIC